MNVGLPFATTEQTKAFLFWPFSPLSGGRRKGALLKTPILHPKHQLFSKNIVLFVNIAIGESMWSSASLEFLASTA
jgi:hypothetical protein